MIEPEAAKRIVADGYDRIADRYAEAGRTRPDAVRAKYLGIAMEAAPLGGRALDVGCGTGELVTATLASRYEVTGVDISPHSIGLACQAVPAATFVVGDVASIELPVESFDLVTAFYSLIHVPSAEQPAVIAAIARWLRPGGTFVATFGAGEAGDSHERDWLGVPMTWGSIGRSAAVDLLRAARFTNIRAEIEAVDEGDAVVEHLWIVATRSPFPDVGASTVTS
jgi:SAM-dependent methyltransferase